MPVMSNKQELVDLLNACKRLAVSEKQIGLANQLVGAIEFVQKGSVDSMVDRFLSWPLPNDFNPDGGIAFEPPPSGQPALWPTGTNLFDAEQAKAMIEHMLDAEE